MGAMEKLRHFQKIHESEVTEPKQAHLENKLIRARSTNITRTLRKPSFPLCVPPLLQEASSGRHAQLIPSFTVPPPLWKIWSGAEYSNLTMAWFVW